VAGYKYFKETSLVVVALVKLKLEFDEAQLLGWELSVRTFNISRHCRA
jgi:hypothetical protein